MCQWLRRTASLGLAYLGVASSFQSVSFVGQQRVQSQVSSSFSGTRTTWRHKPSVQKSQKRSNAKSQLSMFMGSDGGILGIGTPEVFTILLVGYFVLGPSDLYKLTKEIGKFIQNFRTFSAEATASLENTMESQLQLDEIRKAQRELNDAFSFRRSINVDEDTEAFEVNAKSPREGDAPEDIPLNTTAADDTGAPKKKRRVRRRVKKQPKPAEEEEETPASVLANGSMQPNVPEDLSMPFENMNKQEQSLASVDAAAWTEPEKDTLGDSAMSALEAAQAELKAERDSELLAKGTSGQDSTMDAFDAAQSRFQSQLSGSWNDQVMAKTEELSPLAAIMEKLAVLEDEKNAADARLQDEFRQREKLEEKFYKQKRQLLEDAAAQVQMQAYGNGLDEVPAITNDDNKTSTKKDESKATATTAAASGVKEEAKA